MYKVALVLRRHRPDLIVLPMNTSPTGVMVVLGADPANKVLHERYDDVLTEWVVPDPQKVPQEILDRKFAVNPRRFLDSPIIPLLLKQRGRRPRWDERPARGSHGPHPLSKGGRYTGPARAVSSGVRAGDF